MYAHRTPNDASWLIRDGMDRERMLDMDRRIRPARICALAVLAAALIASGPWLGWWTLIPVGAAGMLCHLADTLLARTRRPEYVMFAAWAGTQLIIAASVAVTGGAKASALSWLGIPIVTLASRFSARGIAVGVALTISLLLAVAFGVDPGAVVKEPTLVILPAALIVAVTVLSTALMRSDVEFRNRAVIDELTGMLNRTALAARVAELTQQSVMSGEAVGMIMADIDHFKEVNDEHGHARGDEALRDVAFVIRKQLRAYDLAYRLGGEEFLVLLPGATQPHTEGVARQLRDVVHGATLAAGLHLTISCGVAASAEGSPFDYPRTFAAADAALYEAKRSGRDRVCTADAQDGATLKAVAG